MILSEVGGHVIVTENACGTGRYKMNAFEKLVQKDGFVSSVVQCHILSVAGRVCNRQETMPELSEKQ